MKQFVWRGGGHQKGSRLNCGGFVSEMTSFFVFKDNVQVEKNKNMVGFVMRGELRCVSNN